MKCVCVFVCFKTKIPRMLLSLTGDLFHQAEPVQKLLKEVPNNYIVEANKEYYLCSDPTNYSQHYCPLFFILFAKCVVLFSV